MHRFLFAALMLLALCPASTAAAERKDRPLRAPAERVRLFLDCQDTYCDWDYLRTEIAFVDWIRARQDADVHVLLTSQRTGSGGTEYTLKYIGLDRFMGMDQELSHAEPQTATSDERRRGLARILAVGLVRYVALTPTVAQLRVVAEPALVPVLPAASPVNDAWDYWVFRTRIAVQLDGEQQVKSSATSGAFTADRVTEAWKFNLGVDGRYSQSTFALEEGEDPYTSVTRNWSTRGLVVKSLTDRWSAGLRVSASSSTYLNQEFVGRVAPALEYNVFPYGESTRRRLTVQYAAGVRYAEYYQPTVFDLLEETRGDHSLATELDLKQTWGTLNSSVDFQQYFYDLSKYRVGFDNEFDIRLVRGLSLNLNSNAQIIKNQIYLPAGEATPEEILVRQRQLATSYSYWISVGVSYTFGSIFNNVVNRRFGG